MTMYAAKQIEICVEYLDILPRVSSGQDPDEAALPGLGSRYRYSASIYSWVRPSHYLKQYWNFITYVLWHFQESNFTAHYNDAIMGAIAPQITSFTIVFSIVYLDTDQRKHQSSASLAFVCGIHRKPVNSPHKWPVTRKMFPFGDVIM